MKRKLRQQTAETLIEAMVSLLVAMLSISLLFTSIMVATNINTMNREADEKYAEDLKQAEGYMTTPEDGNVVIHFSSGDETIKVKIYGSKEGSFAAYRQEAGR